MPGSTLMYGSNFTKFTRKPRDSRSAPMAAAEIPLPSELMTPPVTKMYLVVRAMFSFPFRWKRVFGGSRPRAPMSRLRTPYGAPPIARLCRACARHTACSRGDSRCVKSKNLTLITLQITSSANMPRHLRASRGFMLSPFRFQR